MSDHLTQFLIERTPEFDAQIKSVRKRSYKNFDNGKFKNDLNKIKWDEDLLINEENPNRSLEKLLEIIEKVSDKHAPMKEFTLKKINLKLNPGSLKEFVSLLRLKINFIKSSTPLKILLKNRNINSNSSCIVTA